MSDDVEYYCRCKPHHGPGPYCIGCGGLIRKNILKEKPIYDRYGSTLEVDKRVAFNKSGEVAIGVITEIKPSARYGKTKDYQGNLYYTFFVREQNTDKISKITSRTNLSAI